MDAPVMDKALLMLVSGLISCLLTLVIIWLSSLHKRQEKQEDNFGTLQKELPEKYVTRDDWVRWSIKVDKKLDQISGPFPETVAKAILQVGDNIGRALAAAAKDIQKG